MRLNAEGRRISESRMRENRTYGLMRERCVKVNTKMHKKGLLKMSFWGTNFAPVVLKELSTYPWFYMTFL